MTLAMNLAWRLMYAVGFTPWDQDEVPNPLRDLVEGEDALPAAAALDLGCGNGRNAIYLARQGWTVTGIDIVPKAIRTGRKRATAAGVEPRLLVGDVTRLPQFVGTDRFSLVLDFGCLHGLSDSQRVAYAAGVNSVAEPGATLLLMAFTISRPPVTTGLQLEQLTRLLGPSWQLAWSAPLTLSEQGTATLRRMAPAWFCYRRGSKV